MWGILAQLPSLLGKGITQIPRVTGLDRVFGGGAGTLGKTPPFVPPITGQTFNPDLVSPGFVPPGGRMPSPDLPIRPNLISPTGTGAGALGIPDTTPPVGNMMDDVRPKLRAVAQPAQPEWAPRGIDMSGEGVPIPQLPGRPGGPIPYDPIAKSRYDYVMKGAKRGEDGMLSGGFNRSGKDVLRNMLIGAAEGYQQGGWGGAAGGAAAGGIGSAINPMAARENVFDTVYQPRMQADQQRLQEQRKREGDWAMQQAKLEYEKARAKDLETRAKMEAEKEAYTRSRDATKDEQWRIGQRERERANRARESGKERDDFILTPQGLWQISTGQLIPNTGKPEALPKPVQPPSAASQSAARLDKLKADAMQAWDEFKGMEKPVPVTDEERAKAKNDKDAMKIIAERDKAVAEYKAAETYARSAVSQLNQATEQLGENYGEHYETGIGRGGWGYYKPRKKGGGATRNSGPNVRQYMSRSAAMNLLPPKPQQQ